MIFCCPLCQRADTAGAGAGNAVEVLLVLLVLLVLVLHRWLAMVVIAANL